MPPRRGATDPVLAQRDLLRRLANLGKRIGYCALAVAIVAFFVGVFTGLPGLAVGLVIAGFAVATAALVPAIILGYAVQAGERDDREKGFVEPTS